MSGKEIQTAFLDMPYEQRFKTIFEAGEGYVKRHFDVNTEAADYHVIEIIAIEKAREGNRVEILPVIHQNDRLRREVLLKNVNENKNPDLRINGQ